MNGLIKSFPLGEHAFFIEGPQGQLEMLTLSASHFTSSVAIICHPHPLHQGTMHNKVVHTLARAFHNRGYHTVRFNYRGVGKSEGSFGNSHGEVEDLMAVIKWVKEVVPHVNFSLAGFSFGSYIAARGASKTACRQLYSVAPAVGNQSFDMLPIINCPWIVIQGERDEVIAPSVVYDWYEQAVAIHPHMQLFKFPNVSHFFHGQLIALRSLVEDTCLAPFA